MADILERLHGLVATCGCGACEDAAAEIKRLNAKVNQLLEISAVEIRKRDDEIERLQAARESLAKDPEPTLDEPDEDWEVIVKMRAIARNAITNGKSDE